MTWSHGRSLTGFEVNGWARLDREVEVQSGQIPGRNLRLGEPATWWEYLSARVAPEEIACDSARGLDKPVLRDLMTCQWIRAHLNVIAVGPTGIGKTFLAGALAQAACRQGFRALLVRVPRLLEQLAIARASASSSSEPLSEAQPVP